MAEAGRVRVPVPAVRATRRVMAAGFIACLLRAVEMPAPPRAAASAPEGVPEGALVHPPADRETAEVHAVVLMKDIRDEALPRLHTRLHPPAVLHLLRAAVAVEIPAVKIAAAADADANLNFKHERR